MKFITVDEDERSSIKQVESLERSRLIHHRSFPLKSFILTRREGRDCRRLGESTLDPGEAFTCGVFAGALWIDYQKELPQGDFGSFRSCNCMANGSDGVMI